MRSDLHEERRPGERASWTESREHPCIVYLHTIARSIPHVRDKVAGPPQRKYMKPRIEEVAEFAAPGYLSVHRREYFLEKQLNFRILCKG